MTVFRNVMVYLGLGPDEEYEDGYLQDDNEAAHDDGYEPARRSPQPSAPAPMFGNPDAETRSPDDDNSPSAVGAVRPLRPVAADPVLDLDAEDRIAENRSSENRSVENRNAVRRIDADVDAQQRTSSFSQEPVGIGAASGRPAMSTRGFGESHVDPVVRAVPIPRTKPLAIVPDSFGDAKTIADEFQRSVPVIMNLQGLDRELARRLIDFASGVCYSLNGSMEKIASQVFLLTPKSVDVSDEDMRRIEERGYTR